MTIVCIHKGRGGGGEKREKIPTLDSVSVKLHLSSIRINWQAYYTGTYDNLANDTRCCVNPIIMVTRWLDACHTLLLFLLQKLMYKPRTTHVNTQHHIQLIYNTLNTTSKQHEYLSNIVHPYWYIISNLRCFKTKRLLITKHVKGYIISRYNQYNKFNY